MPPTQPTHIMCTSSNRLRILSICWLDCANHTDDPHTFLFCSVRISTCFCNFWISFLTSSCFVTKRRIHNLCFACYRNCITKILMMPCKSTLGCGRPITNEIVHMVLVHNFQLTEPLHCCGMYSPIDASPCAWFNIFRKSALKFFSPYSQNKCLFEFIPRRCDAQVGSPPISGLAHTKQTC